MSENPATPEFGGTLPPASPVVEAPEGIEFDVKVYLTSDESGLDMRMTIGGVRRIGQEALATAWRGEFGETAGIKDWRLMNAQEVADYKARKDEDEDEDEDEDD